MAARTRDGDAELPPFETTHVRCERPAAITTRTKGALLGAGALLAACACFPHVADARDKTDIVTLRNGDRVTGEIKALEYGLLELSTDFMGTLKIEWNQVASIESEYAFDVERIGGARVYGTLSTTDKGALVINDSAEPESVPLGTVTRLSGVESGFWERVNGTLSIGYNYTKSSDISVANFSFTSRYDTPRIRSTLDANANRTTSPESESTQQENISSTVQFLSEKPRFWILLNSLESNEQLGIERRLQSGGAVGRYFRQSADSELTGLAGIVVNQEWTTTTIEDDQQLSMEGVIGAQWRVFRFSDPEVSLSAQAALYPSLTESGRYRGSMNVTLSRDLIKDLTFNLSLYESYDSDPPQDDGEALKEDYGIVTSIGYKF
jgi:uncharacterized protein DUF481